jgi:glucose-1-phosphate cytidylyltransferase
MGVMQVVILCGGKGARLKEKTQYIPKVLVEVGGRPILWHIMKGYAAFGYTDFVLCLGYLGEKVREFFGKDGVGIDNRSPGVMAADTIHYHKTGGDPWRITCVDTGLETNTGGRIRRVAPYVEGETFFATYGDGVADLELPAVLEFHRRHGRVATLTAVNPISQFGILELDGGGLITAFREKPHMKEWVNGGFFVFERAIFDYLHDDSILERAPFERLARERQIVAYQHRGFWACMDTYKDTVMLDDLWRAGKAPWKMWEG